jgi:hypothetical protein
LKIKKLDKMSHIVQLLNISRAPVRALEWDVVFFDFMIKGGSGNIQDSGGLP